MSNKYENAFTYQKLVLGTFFNSSTLKWKFQRQNRLVSFWNVNGICKNISEYNKFKLSVENDFSSGALEFRTA